MKVTRRSLVRALGFTATRLFGQQVIRGWPWTTMEFQTTKAAGFSPVTLKTGATLHWIWGDGTYTDNNSPTKNYPAGTKTLWVSSRDGFRLMTYFDVNHQSMLGPLPSFAACVGLTNFYPFSNSFNGTLPSFAACILLQDFDISTNAFTGVLPPFPAATVMYSFWCTSNKLTGTLPSFSGCVALDDFRCNSNAFSGNLPSFSACTLLTTFQCSTNKFSGTLPDFSACTLLKTFFCDHNSFSGALPSFAACTALLHFQCNNNGFSGALPSFATCTALLDFSCGDCAFSGTLPDFSSCTALVSLQVRDQAFSGTTAGSFATQKSLNYANFYQNALTQAAVDQILADFVVSLGISGRVACTVYLDGGTNAHPSAAGLASKALLVTAGWTVTNN